MVAQTNFKHIGLLVYGRFPTEKAYGGHVFEIAKSFTELNIKTTIFYSKTNNKKTIFVKSLYESTFIILKLQYLNFITEF